MSGFNISLDGSLGILIVTAILVHAIKAFRLYFALYGTDISLRKYLETYCIVTPVSIIVPFKLGDLCRMWCYGAQIGNYLRGIVIILLDRFVDTVALITIIGVIWFFNGGKITVLICCLLLFIIGIVIIYRIFPNFYSFWKKFLLCAKASEHKLMGIRTLESLHSIYMEIENVVKGKGVILYISSLIAWIIEIGSALLINRRTARESNSTLVANYLSSAMSGKESVVLHQFVWVSIAVLLFTFLVLRITRIINERKDG